MRVFSSSKVRDWEVRWVWVVGCCGKGLGASVPGTPRVFFVGLNP